jgi:hypothetical protein
MELKSLESRKEKERDGMREAVIDLQMQVEGQKTRIQALN